MDPKNIGSIFNFLALTLIMGSDEAGDKRENR
jgi:hypothetical protein